MSINWIESCEYERMKFMVLKSFNSIGWNVIFTPSTTVARKTFKSLAGEKDCFVYLSNYDSNNWRLTGEFITEGNNILLTTVGFLNKHHQEDDVSMAVSAFVGIITSLINECRIVRLA